MLRCVGVSEEGAVVCHFWFSKNDRRSLDLFEKKHLDEVIDFVYLNERNNEVERFECPNGKYIFLEGHMTPEDLGLF